MSVRRTTFYADGMTCSACESRVSKSIAALAGVIGVEVRLKGGTVTVEYDDAAIGPDAMKAAVGKAGYCVRDRRGSGTPIALGIGLLLVAAYLAAGSKGVFANLPKIDASIGYAMLFVTGLLTSIHCVAMCGGIALSQSVGLSGNADRQARQGCLKRIRPGLLYNAGRIVSYTAIGGIVGAAGAAFSFSPTAKGIIAGLAGLFMIMLALRMLGLLRPIPLLARLIPDPVRKTAANMRSALGKGGPFVVGLLNGLMPCGPLQTMQLYALGTGSALTGALSMLIFSMGTVPLMLLFGATAAILPGKFVPAMVRASAVLVMFLGVVTFARAATLAGLPLPSANRAPVAQNAQNARTRDAGTTYVQGKAAAAGTLRSTVSGNEQTVVTEFRNGQYVPFAVQAGIPLKWTIRVTESELNGCNNPLVIPAYGITKELVPGDNLIEFTPAKAGTIPYSCWMGMVRSSIAVVDGY